ncbi:MAG: hypothetical protein KatS3mg057_2383 [Herpetosiphonaceae bacterium]|nr:MAG: hypothetical protein KatS3mg057_2383 [Herpetosiphonaceae bacterium]
MAGRSPATSPLFIIGTVVIHECRISAALWNVDNAVLQQVQIGGAGIPSTCRRVRRSDRYTCATAIWACMGNAIVSPSM